MHDFGIDPFAIDVDPEGYDGPPTRVAPFIHRSGWLRISEARFEMPFITWRRTLIACVTDYGERLAPWVASLLFAMPTSPPRSADENPPDELDEVTDDLYADFLGRTDADNLLYLEEASERAAAKITSFEAKGAALLAKMDAVTRALRAERRKSDASPAQRAAIDAKLDRLAAMGDELAIEARRRAAGIRGETVRLEADIFAALREHGEVEHHVTVRWRSLPMKFGRPVWLDTQRPDSEVWSLVVRDRSTLVSSWWR